MLHIFTAVLALSDPSAEVVRARIADVIAHPGRFHDQHLSIRGQVDACHRDVCRLCPEVMRSANADASQCLDIELKGIGEDWVPGHTESPEDRVAEQVRFSVITAKGLFDADCQGTMMSSAIDGPETPGSCGPPFAFVEVLRVHRRLRSNEGLVWDHQSAALHPAPADVASEIETIWRRELAEANEEPVGDQIAVFLSDAARYRHAQAEARLCVCLKADCSADWPKRDISTAAPTSRDPFACYAAARFDGDGGWRVYP